MWGSVQLRICLFGGASGCYRLLQATRMQAFISVSFWLGVGALLPNFIARKRSLRGQVLTGRIRASNSEIWRARLGH